MTILNVALAGDRALIVTDSQVSRDDASCGCVSKAVALPHLQLVVAGTGLHVILETAARAAMMPMPLGTDVADLAATLPELLAWSWEQIKERVGADAVGSTRIVLIGARQDSIHAYCLESPEFTALKLAPGFYPQPGLRASADAGDDAEDTTAPAAPSAPASAPIWQDLVRSCYAVVPLQQAQGKVPIGGHQIEVFIDLAAVRMVRLGEFD